MGLRRGVFSGFGGIGEVSVTGRNLALAGYCHNVEVSTQVESEGRRVQIND